MTLEYLNRVEPWSYPIPHYTEQAQVWHSRRYANWLLKAGAEPRFGALLCSGSQAEARWMLLLEEQGIDVLKVSSHIDRPLPHLLTEHRGDHFNRKLFLVDGLDAITHKLSEEEHVSFWKTLDGQRNQFKQTATWVTLKFSHPQTLVMAQRYAPRLMAELDRVCWVWSSSERSQSTERVNIQRDQHQHVYRCFAAAAAYDSSIDHQTLGRIFRCGYMKPSRKAHQRWIWSYTLWRGEVRDSMAARFGQQGVTESLSETVSADDAIWALKGRSEAATPARKLQWEDRALGSPQAWQVSAQASLALDHLSPLIQEQAVLLEALVHHRLQDSIPSKEDLKKVELILPLLDAEQILLRGQVTECLTHLYAQNEDIEGCRRVNQELAKDDQVWPEIRFVAYERLVDLALYAQNYTDARKYLDQLEYLDLFLHAPLFQVRYLEAKAKCIGALDPDKGLVIIQESENLSRRFGGLKLT